MRSGYAAVAGDQFAEPAGPPIVSGGAVWNIDLGLKEVNNPPLHALADGVDGGNGLYLYTAASAFPVNSYLASNYWVDVVFHP